MLETERLVLRRPAIGDAPAIFERYARHPQVTRYLTWPAHRSLEETRSFLQGLDESIERVDQAAWTITERTDERPCGMLSLLLSPPEVRFGYCLAESAWGRGVATEAAGAVLPLVWEITELQQVVAHCHPAHERSARVLEKLGFACTGLERRYVVLPALGRQPQDMLRYVLHRE